MDEGLILRNKLPENGLLVMHRQWALWATRRLRFAYPELTVALYGLDWNFTIYVANCKDEDFPALSRHFDHGMRPLTCNIQLSSKVPEVGTLIDEEIEYEAELWLNGDPLSAYALNTLMLLAEPTLPDGGIDFDNDRNTWIFQSSASLTDVDNSCIQKAAAKVGIAGPIEVIKISAAPNTTQSVATTSQRQSDLSLITSRRLRCSSASLRELVEKDEDEWRVFLSQRARQELVEPDKDFSQHFACLYDVEHCGDSRLSELLTIYDRVDIIPPVMSGDGWCEKHKTTLSDLQELVRLKRVRIVLPHSIDRYSSSIIEAVAEVDRASIVPSRTLAAKTIIRGQAKEPLLYAPLTSYQRLAILSAISQSITDKTYLGLINSYGQLFPGQHDRFMMCGALASLGFGVGAYLGEVFLKLGKQDARIELMTCGAGVEWAIGLGASYIPRAYDAYDETWNSQIIASYLGRTRLRQSDPVANRMHVVANGLLAVSDAPALEVAKNFHSFPISRFRNLARKLMAESADESELQCAIDQINADVRVFEHRAERLACWKLGSLFTTTAVTSAQDSLGMGVAASVISSWLYEVLEQKIPSTIRNEISDAKHMLMGLATGATLDAVVVSRSRKAITRK